MAPQGGGGWAWGGEDVIQIPAWREHFDYDVRNVRSYCNEVSSGPYVIS